MSFFKYINQSNFNLKCRELYELLDFNEKLIIKKQENPSLSISINSISELIKALNLLIIEANKLITIFNSKISEFSVSEGNITNQFWTLIRCESSLKLDEYDKFDLNSVKKELRYKRQLGRLSPIKKSLEEQKKIELTKTTNIEESRDKINARLHSLGVEGFSVDIVEGNIGSRYRIVRSGTDQPIFKTLSEGEKTIITFIYFLESILGVDPQLGNSNLQSRIVVIDDPISSLSHNYIYDIARLIKRIFIEEDVVNTKGNKKKENQLVVNQLFVLTHSLYFFHELMLQGLNIENSRNLFRVIKNKNSNITSLKKNEIQNSYQEYWTIFKESTEGSIFVSVLPNVMRNILEEFFSFIHKRGKLKEVLGELSDQDNDFMALERYVNRESHSDLLNLAHFKEIPISKYREIFRRIFERSGHIEHYEIMMQD